ncbi:MAG: hypothetical protein DRP01_03530 [Archaeoglobales archaeon]|nr:MAG: hypothetical protein DRP01_03530 [Archaeoglobales archaeon]
MLTDVKLFRRSNGYWYIRFERGKERSLRTKDKKLAEKLFKEVQKEILKGRLVLLEKQQRITLKQFIEEYLSWSANYKSYNTYRLDRHCFSKLLDYLGDIPLKTISVKKLEEYFGFLKTKGQKPTGINIEMRHIKAGFNKAIAWGYLKENPLAKIKPLKIHQSPPKFLSKEEIKLVLGNIKNPDFKDLIICYLETGCRRAELINLRVEDIDIKNQFIKVRGKGSKTRIVPMTKTVIEIMNKRIINKTKQQRIFPAWHPDTVSHMWAKLMKKLGLKYRLHDLRHTTASYLAMKGVSLKIIQELLGHSDIKATQIYSHLCPETIREALSLLNMTGNVNKNQAGRLKRIK